MSAEQLLTIYSELRGDVTVLRVGGELDASSAGRFVDACASSFGDVEADLVELDFLDGGGYRALTAAREAVESNGGCFRVWNVIGEPARLLLLLAGTALADPRLETHLGFTHDDARALFPAGG